MGANDNFCLRWNEFETNFLTAFRELRSEEAFFDVSLSCDGSQGRTVQAHRVILSACSPLLKKMLKNAVDAAPGNPNLLLYIRGVKFTDLESIVDFIYQGEVNVEQTNLNNFLAVAEDLQIKGLAQSTSKDNSKYGGNKRRAGKSTTPGISGKRTRKIDLNDTDAIKDLIKDENEFNTDLESTSRSGGNIAVINAADNTTFVEQVRTDGNYTTTTVAYDQDYRFAGNEVRAVETEIIPQVAEDNSKVVTDLNEVVTSLLTFSDGIHTCNLCGKKSPWRTTMLRHIEANHVETAGHVCDICGQVCKTRPAFAMHKKRKHKLNMANEPIPDPSQKNRPPPTPTTETESILS